MGQMSYLYLASSLFYASIMIKVVSEVHPPDVTQNWARPSRVLILWLLGRLSGPLPPVMEMRPAQKSVLQELPWLIRVFQTQ